MLARSLPNSIGSSVILKSTSNTKEDYESPTSTHSLRDIVTVAKT